MLGISIYYFSIFFVWSMSVLLLDKVFRQVSLFFSFIILIWSLYIAYMFSYYTTLFDSTVLLYQFSLWNFNYQCQLDGVSILFVILSNILLVLCLLVNWIWSTSIKRL